MKKNLFGIFIFVVQSAVAQKFPENQIIDNPCSNTEFGFVPDPTTCRNFIMCLFFNPIVIICPTEFPVFDPKLEKCVGSNPDDCLPVETTSTIITTLSTTYKSTSTSEETSLRPTASDEPVTTETSSTETPTTLPKIQTTPGTTIKTVQPTTSGEITATTHEPTHELTPTTHESTTTKGLTTTTKQPTTSTHVSTTTKETTTTTAELTKTTNKATTTSHETTTSEGPSNTTTTTSPPGNPCLNVISGFVPHPTLCYRYYRCLFGTPQPRECPIDRIFENHPITPGCVLGDRETCRRT